MYRAWTVFLYSGYNKLFTCAFAVFVLLLACVEYVDFIISAAVSALLVKVKVKVILRPTVCQPVRLGIRHPPGTRDQFFPFSFWLFFFWQFRVRWCGVPSLMRCRVWTFQFLLGIASAAFLRSESHGTHKHSLLSLFLRLPQPGGPGSVLLHYVQCTYYYLVFISCTVLNSELCVSRFVLFLCRLFMLILYMWNFSNILKCFPFLCILVDVHSICYVLCLVCGLNILNHYYYFIVENLRISFGICHWFK
jgi:hypothetical protein